MTESDIDIHRNRSQPILQRKAIDLIDLHVADAIHKVKSCTPLETVLLKELRIRKMRDIERIK